LPLPVTGSGPEYYKRQLWIHNFCIHILATNDATMFVYAEHFAGKGPNEIISILLWYFENILPKQTTHLYIFADNCSAQNKNRFLWNFLQSMVENGRFQDISFSYPIPGHSFMACDRDFALIEKKRRNADLVTVPSQWVKLVKETRS